MSLQQQEFSQDLKFKLKVKYDTKPKTLLPTARKISDDLRVKVKEVGILFETHKKAWLIEQVELNEQKLLSTIIQQTTSGAWVSFDVPHDKDVEIQKVFVEQTKASRDLKIMMYPMYFLMGILLTVMIILLKKTLIDKEIIILTKQDWQVIIWIGVAIIGWFCFMFLYIIRKKIHESYFQSVGSEFVSERTLDFYFKVKNHLGQVKVMRYSLTLQCFKGKYYHPDLPEVVHFKEDRIDLDTLENIRHELKLADDHLRTIKEQEMELHEEISVLRSEERELKQALTREETASMKQAIENLDHPESATTSEVTVKLSENEKILEQKDEKLREIQSQLAKEEKEYSKEKEKLQKEFFEIVKDVYSLNEKDLKNNKLEEIIYGHQLSEKLRSKIADKNNVIITLNETIAGIYNTLMQLEDSFDQRVAEESARRTNTHYEYQIVSDPNQSAVIYGEGTGGVTRQGQKKDRSSLWINSIITLITTLGIIGAVIYGIIKLVETMKGVHPFLIVLIILAMALVLVLINKALSRAMKYARDDDTSMKIN